VKGISSGHLGVGVGGSSGRRLRDCIFNAAQTVHLSFYELFLCGFTLR